MTTRHDGRPAKPGEAARSAGEAQDNASAEDSMIIDHVEEGLGRKAGRAPGVGMARGPGLYAPGAEGPPATPGLHRADQIQVGEPYEVSGGQVIECMPTGGRGASSSQLGASVVGWDPAVRQTGVDAGFAPGPSVLRAPDIAVGNVADVSGWVPGVPELAIEYADIGQHEGQLQRKIDDLLEAGTQIIWLARLSGPRRVEIYERGQTVRLAVPGDLLHAPGILKNPVPVDALFDRDEAERVTLANLLQRQGYDDLEAVRAEARVQTTRAALRRVLLGRGLAPGDAEDARIASCADLPTLERWLDAAVVAPNTDVALR